MAIDKRLNQIQTGTLTESRMNEDFVFWMKTTGLNIVLIILLVGCGYMGWHWWQRNQSQTRAAAWRQLDRATTPQDLAVVVTDSGTIDSIGLLARIRAGDTYLDSLMTGFRFDREPGAEDAKITAELRTEWLDNADQLFLEVAQELSGTTTPQSLEPMAFHALMGRAAIAESRGDGTAAKRFLDEAAARVATNFPALAEVAKKRGEGIEVIALGAELPPLSSLPTGSAGSLFPNSPANFPNIPGMRITPSGTAPPSGAPMLPFPPPVNDPSAPPLTPVPSAPPAATPPAPVPSVPPAAPPAP